MKKNKKKGELEYVSADTPFNSFEQELVDILQKYRDELATPEDTIAIIEYLLFGCYLNKNKNG